MLAYVNQDPWLVLIRNKVYIADSIKIILHIFKNTFIYQVYQYIYFNFIIEHF